MIKYLTDRPEPVGMSALATELREQNTKFSDLLDADFRNAVQPMIATGKLDYVAGLKIKLGKTAK